MDDGYIVVSAFRPVRALNMVVFPEFESPVMAIFKSISPFSCRIAIIATVPG
jgi:hypothetical protein